MKNIFQEYHSLIEKFSLEISSIIGKLENTDLPFSLITDLQKTLSFLKNITTNKSSSAAQRLDLYKNSLNFLHASINTIDTIIEITEDKKLITQEKINLQLLFKNYNELSVRKISLNRLEDQYKEYNNENLKEISQEKIINLMGTPTIGINTSNSFIEINKSIEALKIEITNLQSTIEENKDEVSKNSSAINSAYHQLQEAYRKSIDFIEQSNNKIHELLSIASSSVINGSYKENSLRELRTADRLRGIAILLMVGIVFFTSHSVYELHQATIDPWIFLLRLLAGAIFSIPAIYLTRESSKHRYNHLIYLQKSLDLAAFEPFTSGIGTENLNKLRSEMVKNIFFTKPEKDVSESYPIDWNTIIKDLASRIDLKNK